MSKRPEHPQRSVLEMRWEATKKSKMHHKDLYLVQRTCMNGSQDNESQLVYNYRMAVSVHEVPEVS